jgi:hypothetical protein
MRLSMFGVVLLAATAACVEGQPRPVVVLVHGRGHLGDDTASLRRTWKSSLDSALRQVQLPALPDSDVRLAWYADVLDPAEDAGCPVPAPLADSAGLETFARDFLTSLATALPRNESREVRTFLGDMLYAVDASRRCGAQRRVGRVIDSARAEGRPVIVVAYSLGAVVTYAELARRAKSDIGPAIRLVTIGSPLGNPELRELLGEGVDPLRLPPHVASWDNIYNGDDAFAAALATEVSGVVDWPIPGDSRNDPHHVLPYLRHRVTGEALGRALCASTSNKSEPCSRF